MYKVYVCKVEVCEVYMVCEVYISGVCVHGMRRKYVYKVYDVRGVRSVHGVR